MATETGNIVLHWSPKSPFVRKVMIFLHETGLEDRIEKTRSVTNMLIPNRGLMEHNPFSKIPTLVLPDGRVLFDSDVICEYLDTLHGSEPLLPPAGDARWQALRWRAFGNEFLHVLILWRNERERPEEKKLTPLIEAFQLKVKTALEFLEREAEVLESTRLGVGHIAIGCALGYMDYRFPAIDWRGQAPAIAKWHAGFAARPSVKSTEPIDDIPHVTAGQLSGKKP